MGVEAVRRNGLASCPMCGSRFRPGDTRLRACRREVEAVREREQTRPLDVAASLVVFGATAVVLFRALCGPISPDPLAGPVFWLIPGCVVLLALVAFLGYRADSAGRFAATRATALTLLVALLAPVLYSLLPVGAVNRAVGSVASVAQPVRGR